MGTVYLGRREQLDQRVAIKVLHERHSSDRALVERFQLEAKSLAQVNHPNLVTLLDYGRNEDGMFFIVLEYCPGLSLAKFLRQRRTLPESLAVDITTQIAQGLTVAHRAGIIHRDLKPENVILTELHPGHYHAKLLDFGIAKSINDDNGPNLTMAGTVFGTPEYMPPEQARGQKVDARSDLYALGTLLYELVCGQPPFVGNDKVAVMTSQASEIPKSPRSRGADISPELESIILRCLEKNPANRFASAGELIEAFISLPKPYANTASLPPEPSREYRVEPVRVEAPVHTPAQLSVPENVCQEPSLAFDHSVTAHSTPAHITPASTGTHNTPKPLDRPSALSQRLDFEGPVGEETSPRPSPLQIAFAIAILAGLCVLAAVFSSGGDSKTSEGVKSTPIIKSDEPKADDQDSELNLLKLAAAHAKSDENSNDSSDETAKAEENSELEALEKAKAEAEAKIKAEAEEQARRAAEEKAKQEQQARELKAKANAEKAKADAIAKSRAEKDRAKRADQALKRAETALISGKFDEAIDILEKYLKEDPNDKAVSKKRGEYFTLRNNFSIGDLAYKNNDCASALEALTPVLKAAPKARRVKKMVDDCTQALPPKEL